MYTNDIDNRRMFHCFTSYNWQSRLVLDFGCGRAITGFHAVLLWSVHTYFKTGIGSKQRRVTWLWNMFCSLEDGKLIGLVWFKISGSVQDGASTIAKLPYKWLNHGFFVRYNELVHVLYVMSPFTLIKQERSEATVRRAGSRIGWLALTVDVALVSSKLQGGPGRG
jgi:hypothetical protein